MDLHPNDKLAALEWAVQQATKAATTGDAIVRLNTLPALQQLRDDAKREAGR